MSKIIVNEEEILKLRKCTLTYGHFDLVHPGHIRYLRKASNEGYKLVVAVIPDYTNGKSNKYKFNQIERAEGLTSFSFVDAIILLKDEEYSLMKLINKLDPNLFLLGREYLNNRDSEILSAIEAIKQKGSRIKFHAGEIQYASTKLLDKTKDALINENRNKFKLACIKQNIDINHLKDSIKSWKEKRILVLGDAILDQFAGCEAVGMSAEAPVLVVKELQTRNFNGGAAIVASHVKALGAECEFLSVVGDDENAEIIKNKLREEKVKSHIIKDKSRVTTLKKRYLVENQKLLRVSKLDDHSLERVIEDQIIKKIEEIAPSINGIIISDFVYGVITENIIKKVLDLSRKYDIKIFGDVQCSSQFGIVTKFKDFYLISPNEKEARMALQDNVSGLENLSMQLMEITKTKNLVMKLGPDGLIAYQKISSGDIIRQSFPALSANPVDVAGAGDALLAVLAISLCCNDNLMHAASLGSCASAIAVENLGNRPIDSNSLINFLNNSLDNN